MQPIVAADVDLRDFAFMPLDVVRLRDSDLAAIASGDGFRAAVLLWCAAWHQVPAASLPKDDRALAHLAGYGRNPSGWRKIKSDAMRGFVECDDGRLYHATIAEKANEAWQRKQAFKNRTAAARAARIAKDNATKSVTDNYTECVTDHKGEGQGTGDKRHRKSSRRSFF